jgi:hypothetical protein
MEVHGRASGGTVPPGPSGTPCRHAAVPPNPFQGNRAMADKPSETPGIDLLIEHTVGANTRKLPPLAGGHGVASAHNPGGTAMGGGPGVGPGSLGTGGASTGGAPTGSLRRGGR